MRQICVFSPDYYSKEIVRELEGLLGFVTGGHSLNIIRYADDSDDGRHSQETAKTTWEGR